MRDDGTLLFPDDALNMRLFNGHRYACGIEETFHQNFPDILQEMFFGSG